VGEVEGRDDDLAAHPQLGAAAPPAKAAGDHEVQDDEELVVQFQHDALADSPDAADRLAERGLQRRIVGAEQERREDLHLFQRAPGHVPLQAFEVRGDVRKLGHACDVSSPHGPLSCLE
jgi:hypothetical protein